MIATYLLISVLFAAVIFLILVLGNSVLQINELQAKFETVSKQLTGVSDFTMKLHSSCDYNQKSTAQIVQYINDHLRDDINFKMH